MQYYRWIIDMRIIFGAISLSLLVSCAGAGQDSHSKEVFKITDPIIMAVEQYKIENKAYPRTLNVLEPDYIAKLPKAKLNELGVDYRSWKNKQSYKFRFNVSSTGRCSYTPETKWECSDK